MGKVLVTGFEAFGNTPVNPAELVARALDGMQVSSSQIISRIVPNVFFECIDHVSALIRQIRPELVIMMGEYGGRATITVERIAQNLNDSTRYKLADNSGTVLQGQLTVPDGPVAYYSTLPMRAMVKAMRQSGIPSDISDAPGTFCCNHLLYGILHYISTNVLSIPAGWIHLPHLPSVAAMPENLGAPSMSVETAVKGVLVGIRAALENPEDIEEPIVSRLQI
ncbi:MAG: pyroglutamyl-peptidase I [Desulfobacteraceae bacterium]|nr:pyroglutamyl-peptidase I [Desulfobacteraceae bacterium]